MSESQQADRTRELGELFVTVTGDDTVTERQEEGASKEPADEETADSFENIEDGLEGAVDADLDADA
jgi:hypothetical protein